MPVSGPASPEGQPPARELDPFEEYPPTWAYMDARDVVREVQERERDGKDARVLVDLVAAVLAFLGQALEGRDGLVEERHDDRRVDVGVHAERDDRESSETAAREEIEQVDQLVVLKERVQLVLVHPRQRDVSEESEDQDHSEREEDLVPEIRGAERIDERLEHAHTR